MNDHTTQSSKSNTAKKVKITWSKFGEEEVQAFDKANKKFKPLSQSKKQIQNEAAQSNAMTSEGGPVESNTEV